MSQVSDIITFKTKMMAQANLNEMATAVNANSPRPDIVYPEGYLDMYEIGTDRPIMAEEDVLKYLSKVQTSSQSREELCYIMTTKVGSWEVYLWARRYCALGFTTQ